MGSAPLPRALLTRRLRGQLPGLPHSPLRLRLRFRVGFGLRLGLRFRFLVRWRLRLSFRLGRGRQGLGELREICGDFRVMWISVQRARIPASRFVDVAALPSDIAEVTEYDDVLGIERERQID